MKRQTTGMLTLASALALGLAIQGTMTAQQPRKPDASARAEASRGGADPNIKQTREQVTKGKPAAVPAPGEKLGENTRQRVCRVVFDNYTNQWIDAYADGSYRGQIPPYGELGTYVYSGPTLTYGASSTHRWGPHKFTCDALYTWQLLP